MTSDDIISIARETLGTPFRHQGRVVGLGLDCAGVALYVAGRLGLETIDVVGYGTTPANGMLEETLDQQPCLVEVNDRQPGDILLMRIFHEPQHLAIFTGGTIIHSYANVGICCEHDLDDRWKSLIIKAYRFIGVEL